MAEPRGGTSLASRLAVATALVAALSAVLAGVLTAPLLRSATGDAVRQPLASQAELLARLPRAALSSNRITAITAAQDLSVGVLTARGVPRGAAVALTAAQRSALLSGRPVSATGRLDGVAVLVEARPARVGGAVVLVASDDSLSSAAGRLRARVLLAIGLGLLAAVLTALLVSRRLAEPLSRTAAAARRLAAGERGVPLPDDRTREVADVVEALRHLDQALTASEQRQRLFLTSVSHELRTPLTSVRGYAEALVDGAVAAEEMPAVGRTLLGEAERLSTYVDDLLALARLEADDFRLDVEPVDLGALVAATAGAWEERCRRSGLRLRLDTAGPSPVVDTDPVRVRQVLDALTDNAVRVCVPGDEVVLSVRRTAGGARLEVRDSGPGLSEEDARDAFEPGTLHARYAGTRPGGHGLGLAIVGRLVRRLGGRVDLSAAPEGGACFGIDLPRNDECAGTP